MKSSVIGLAAALTLIASVCVGAILAGPKHPRELSWVAMAATTGVVLLACLVILA